MEESAFMSQPEIGLSTLRGKRTYPPRLPFATLSAAICRAVEARGGIQHGRWVRRKTQFLEVNCLARFSRHGVALAKVRGVEETKLQRPEATKSSDSRASKRDHAQ